MHRPLAKTPQELGNPAERTHPPGAVWRHLLPPMGYPAPVGRRTLGRVARAAKHRGVRDVERRTASGERHDVIDGQVRGSVGVALVAGTPVTVLTTPGPQHAGAEPLPGPRAVQGVVATAVRLARVRRAATTRAARQYAADRAQLHLGPGPLVVPRLTLVTLECTPVDIVMSVIRRGYGVYSPRVLRLWSQGA